MNGAADTDIAPVLVPTQVADDIRHAESGGILRRRTDPHATRCPVAHTVDVSVVPQLGRNCAGKAVPELRGVGQNLDAIIISVTRGLGVVVAHQLGGAEDVKERLRLAEGEAGKLNEGPLGDKGRRVSIVHHRADAQIATDRSVFRLVARIRSEHRAAGELEVIRRAGEEAIVEIAGGEQTIVGAAKWQALRGAPLVLRPHIAADAEAHVGAGDVIEPHTIHAADLHIFDRLGLDREIGSLRAGQRDETADAAD